MERIEANVTGRVQGVSFRYYTQREAMRLGVRGWVRNENDGSVRVVAEGDEAQLQALIDFLHHGPPYAAVKEVDVSWTAATGEFQKFEVRFR